jgi:putative pyruvate formate lyase activating enzyme
MNQYHPFSKAFERPPLDRRITMEEFAEAVTFALEDGLARLDGMAV